MNIANAAKLLLRPVFSKNKIYLFNAVIPFKRYNIEDSIIISSETRGGSTWLMELLHAVPDTIVNWEPLHEKKGSVPREYKWGERPYIPESENNPKAKKLMERILRFKVYSSNSIRYCTFSDLVKSKRVLTKMVRSNLLLPWLTSNFEFKHKPIYLLRHPVAVARSQIRNIPESQGSISEFNKPDTINNERYKQNLDYLNSLNTHLERQVALWCLHNIEIINHPDSGKKWAVVFYEELLLSPKEEIRRISKELKLDIPADQINIEKPSAADFFNEYQKEKSIQLSKWKTGLSEQEIKNLQKVLDHYQLKIYSINSATPLH